MYIISLTILSSRLDMQLLQKPQETTTYPLLPFSILTGLNSARLQIFNNIKPLCIRGFYRALMGRAWSSHHRTSKRTSTQRPQRSHGWTSIPFVNTVSLPTKSDITTKSLMCKNYF